MLMCLQRRYGFPILGAAVANACGAHVVLICCNDLEVGVAGSKLLS